MGKNMELNHAIARLGGYRKAAEISGYNARTIQRARAGRGGSLDLIADLIALSQDTEIVESAKVSIS